MTDETRGVYRFEASPTGWRLPEDRLPRYEVIEDDPEARAERVRRIGRRTTIEISQLLESLPPDADPADAINKWAHDKIRERWWQGRPLAERYPDVADVAAKHCQKGTP